MTTSPIPESDRRPAGRRARAAARAAALAVGLLLACSDPPPPAAEHEAPAPTHRIAVPEPVRRNLGIEFVAVERRRIASTLRVPGHFELLPAGRREYRTPLAGRVVVAAQPLQAVVAGDVLYRIDAPEWRRIQRELAELTTTGTVTDARIAAMRPLLDAHAVHQQSLLNAAAVMEARVESLEATRAEVGGQASELAAAQVQLAQVRAELAEAGEKQAATAATVAELEAERLAVRERLDFAVDAAAALLGRSRADLRASAGDPPVPGWRRIDEIEVRAVAGGTVHELPVATGGWVEVGDLVASTADPERIRFRARALQSDLPRLRDGLPARVVPPQGSHSIEARVDGALELGVEADPAQRTIDLFLQPAALPPWARPGMAGFLEVETRGDDRPQLAVPLSAVLQDGLQRVLFRRDPRDPDTVIRIEADLGVDDGRWVAVESGLMDGDAVVLAGAYELMLSSSGAVTRGGHFHADGTFHGEDR